MRKLLRLATLGTALAILTVVSATAYAQTPEPTETSAPEEGETPAAEVGVRHVLEVQTEDGSRAPDGWVVKISNGALRPPANEEELEEARTREYCGVITVQSGAAELIPEFSEDCPEGMPVVLTLFESADATEGIVASTDPAVEWRTALAGEDTRSIVVRPNLPHAAGGDTQTGIQPPSTGDAFLARDNGSSWSWGYLPLGVAVILGIMSVTVAVVERRRQQG